jgi:acetyl-CoA C-acetyltransferase
MTVAYIVGAARTPVGRRRGGLSEVHPIDLSAELIQHLVERTGIEAALVDDVILGCVNQVGAQASNIARSSWLAAGMPTTTPGTTVERQCGSSQQAVHFGAQAVMAGVQDIVLAGGVEVMSKVPIGSARMGGTAIDLGTPFTASKWVDRYGPDVFTQYDAAELIAKKWDVSRKRMEEFALESHRRATAAADAGKFDDEIVPIGEVTRDEGPRADTSLEKMAELRTLQEGGRLTAALSSQISDAASGVIIASEHAVKEYGLTPLAKIHSMTVVGSDPQYMLTGPIPATERILKRSGLTIEDIGRYEVNEAFASVVLAWLAETGADPERTNALGGAIALGHPLGATGTRIMTSLIYEMRRTGSQFGLQTMCEGGGMANATILELV